MPAVASDSYWKRGDTIGGGDVVIGKISFQL